MTKKKEDCKHPLVVLPAEWEEQDGVMLTWPHEATDWKDTLPAICNAYVNLALQIAKREQLIIITPDPTNVRNQIVDRSMENGGYNSEIMGNIHFVKCSTNDTWTRDHGLITLIEKSRQKKKYSPTGFIHLDFLFNGWGEKYEASLDNAINKAVYDSGLLSGRYEAHLDFVLEGGSIESDGEGTVFTTSQCLLAPNRNHLSLQETENELKKRLRAKRIVWIDYGKVEGDDTDGHVDTIVRVAPADTLLYVSCNDEDYPHYESLKKMEDQLQTLQTIRGRAYRLLKLPMPRPIVDGDRILPATYANFLIINDAILYPTYAQPPFDEEAAAVIAEAFPDRKVIGIDATAIIKQGGSLHCCAMQLPKGSMEQPTYKELYKKLLHLFK